MFAIKPSSAKPPDKQKTLSVHVRDTKVKVEQTAPTTQHQNTRSSRKKRYSKLQVPDWPFTSLSQPFLQSSEVLFKKADCTNRGSQPSSPGLSSGSQIQTAKTNQIITITMSHLGQKNPIPGLTILAQTKVSHTARPFTCELSSHAQQ